ncbi:MAG TPA: hypothetical protein VLT62_28360 [Candidatus Methylomirabilis sp.]|nr:hypothetical protein [Candidatus Methylomirabilis sp.]
MPRRSALAVGLILVLGWTPPLVAAETRMILALGNTGFLSPGAIQASSGAEVTSEPDKLKLQDFVVIVLANIAYTALPGSVQQGLVEYVNNGGALLLTGGPQAFGSGGYAAVGPIVPFQIRSDSDWRTTPFRPPIPLQPGHPILAGVEFITVGAVNDMNPRPDATEILRAAGGGSAGRVSYPYPLIAEIGVGAGRVLGIAFDLNEFSGMRDRDQFVQNTISYLLSVSRTGQTR